MVLSERLKHLRLEINSQKLDAVLISKVANIIYLTGYSGFSIEEREAYLLITPKTQFIFTDGRYTQAIKKSVPGFELIEISGKNKFPDLLKDSVSRLKIKRLGIEENDLTVIEFKQVKKAIKNLKDCRFHEHRSIKTEEEIKLIAKACEVGDRVFKSILGRIRPGISEKELGYLLDNLIREQGFEPSFKTIVAYGANSAVPHHQTGESKLKSGDFVLLDFGVKFKNYCSDMTRTLVFGKASEKQEKIHHTVKEAQQKASEFINKQISRIARNDKTTIIAKEVDQIARNYIISQGFPSIPHSLGHGIGIEVHEHPYLSPNSKEILKEGMVFSIEPGIYIPEFGGVRIEDLYVIEKNGIRQLTNSSKELIEI